jgi:hypothetical protein
MAIVKNGHFGFFFQKKINLFASSFNENQPKLLGYQGWVEILMITLVDSKRVSVHNNLLHSVSVNNCYYNYSFLNLKYIGSFIYRMRAIITH